MLDMSPYEFDQTEHGWNSLDKLGSYAEAARIILQYIDKNGTLVSTNPSLETLYFHAGQEFAMQGPEYYKQAIDCFERSFKRVGDWDYYVKGTVAYLKRDSRALDGAILELRALGDIEQQYVLLLQRFRAGLSEKQYSYSQVY